MQDGCEKYMNKDKSFAHTHNNYTETQMRVCVCSKMQVHDTECYSVSSFIHFYFPTRLNIFSLQLNQIDK